MWKARVTYKTKEDTMLKTNITGDSFIELVHEVEEFGSSIVEVLITKGGDK